MKDKIAFFVFGAIVATIAYSVGDITAQNGVDHFETIVVDTLKVNNDIIVGDLDKPAIGIKSAKDFAMISMFSELSSDGKFNFPSIAMEVSKQNGQISIASNLPNPESLIAAVWKINNGRQVTSVTLKDSRGIETIVTD